MNEKKYRLKGIDKSFTKQELIEICYKLSLWEWDERLGEENECSKNLRKKKVSSPMSDKFYKAVIVLFGKYEYLKFANMNKDNAFRLTFDEFRSFVYDEYEVYEDCGDKFPTENYGRKNAFSGMIRKGKKK